MEQQFTILREQLYQERIKQNDLHLNDVRNGRSQEYLEPLKQLSDAMTHRIEVAGVLKRFRLDNITNKFQAEEQGAQQHFAVSFSFLFQMVIIRLINNWPTFLKCRVKKRLQKMLFTKS